MVCRLFWGALRAQLLSPRGIWTIKVGYMALKVLEVLVQHPVALYLRVGAVRGGQREGFGRHGEMGGTSALGRDGRRREKNVGREKGVGEHWRNGGRRALG